jgi:N-methylhydantoinase A
VQRGLDVRDFTLVTFGGSGSLLLCPLIEVLGVRGAAVPPNPGNVSAFGLLAVDVRADYVRTCVARHDGLDYAAMDAIFTALAGRAGEALAAQGFAAAEHRLARTADLRYYGQAFEVRVPVGAGPFGPHAAAAAADRFHQAHRELYGYDFRGDPRQHVEWVNLRVTGIGPLPRPELAALAPGDGDPSRALTGRRPVVFGRPHPAADAAVYWRPLLAAGDELAGPAIIEEYGATVPVHPGFAVRVDGFGNLLVRRSADAAAEAARADRPAEAAVPG